MVHSLPPCRHQLTCHLSSGVSSDNSRAPYAPEHPTTKLDFLHSTSPSWHPAFLWVGYASLSLVSLWAPWTQGQLYFCHFPGGSDNEESTCNTGDLGSIPGSGRSPGEGIDCPLQYSGASRVAQLVKNPPAMWETWAWSLGWEDPLEEGMATPSSVLAWRIPWTEEPGGLQSTGPQRVRHDWMTQHSTQLYSQHLEQCLVIQ